MAMDLGAYIILGLILATLIYAVIIYNHLVTLKHNVAKSWSNIDVLLKQRFDELPKLVEVCRQYMKYEQTTLERVMQARGQVAAAQQRGDMGALGQAEGLLRAGLGQLFALAEAYPDLKANESFRHLQARITGLENAIADRREYYNESVNRNNIRIEQFPDVMVARALGFGRYALLEIAAGERSDVDLGKLFT